MEPASRENGVDGGDPRQGPGDRATFARVLGEGEDPLSWSLPLGRFFRTRVRLHILMPLWITVELLGPLHPGKLGLVYSASLVGAFCVVVVARELCRAAFARAMGRQLDTVVLWPLGGVSHTSPVSRVYPGLQPALAESGGLLFGMLAWPVLAAAVWMLGGGWGQLSVSPLNPAVTLGSIGQDLDSVRATTGANPLVLIGAWSLYYANACVLLANLVLPMFPLDASRVLLAWQERRLGDAAAAAFVAKIGFVAAIAVLLAGAAMESTRLMALAVLGGVATWIELRRSQFLEQPMRLGVGVVGEISRVTPPVSPEAVQEADGSGDEDERRLDAILAKISVGGMGSITDEERAFLKAMTRRRRLE